MITLANFVKREAKIVREARIYKNIDQKNEAH